MTELNETLETEDSEKEDLIPENNKLSDTDADVDENPFFAKNWMSIAKPRELQFQTENLKEDYGKFTLDPLEPGYGVTIGHSLRRVLLSSIRGSAVFAVQIDGVTHEFTNIPGIVEDMVQVILNIKELQIEQYVDEIVELELIGEGPCEIKAGEISTFEKAKILGVRAQMIATGCPSMVNVPSHITSTYDIALLEFKEDKIPLLIRRFLPDGNYEDWRLEDMVLK